jgi:protein-disulfide isomerase
MDHNEKFSMTLSVKQIFLAGVAAGVLGVTALGFILMIAKGVDTSSWFSGSARAPLAAAPSGAAPTGDDNGQQVGEVAPINDEDHMRGDKNAEITLLEYSDFECPFCSRFHPTLVQALNEYKGKVRWVYRHFPLNSIHPNAQKAAEASECASEQGKFWEMADKMFEKQAAGLSITQLSALAKEAGVRDIKKFDSCVSSGKYAQLVAADLASGEAAGVTGTPGTIVIGKDGSKQLIPGALPYDSVKQIIDSMLAS